MITVIVFIIVLGVLIFVHELGHFVVARRNSIRAYEFGFGFPPRIFGFQAVTNPKTKKRKWRMIWGRHDGDSEQEMAEIEEIEEKGLKVGTIYSLNWIPIGGFVRIKGEDGGHQGDKDSFASRGAWTRTRVLAAGVLMNFVLAWFLISINLMIGAPEAVDPNSDSPLAKIQVSEVVPGSPAETMGLQIGDEIAKAQKAADGHQLYFKNISALQDYINSQKGQSINLKINRGSETLNLTGAPRANYPEGQGPLGIALAETQIVSYPWYQAIWKGLVATGDLIVTIVVAFYGLIKSAFMGKNISADISGPVGIAILTRDVTRLGLIYVFQFVALLSVNLGIINILPIPALDGGRILFIIIEKIKGSPVTQKVEQAFHTVFFVLLIMLMVAVTYHDVLKYIIK